MGDFTYRNKNTDQVVTYPSENIRLERSPNWETLTIDGQDTPDAAKYRPDNSPVDQFGAGRIPGLLGSSNVGDRVEERHQIPAGTPDPLHPSPFDPGMTPWTGDPAAQTPVDPAQTDPAATPDPTQTPVSATPDPTQTPAGPAQTPASRPAQAALKPEWVAWAVAQGATKADAEAMTKQDLIDHYSTPGSDA